MPLNNVLHINSESDNCPRYEVFLNSDNEIFIGDTDMCATSWFVLTRDEWEDFKKFVDKEFANI